MPDHDVGPDYVAYAGLGALSLCFGSAFFFNVLTLEWFSALGSGAGRMILAATFMVPAAYLAGHGLPRTLNLWLWVSALGAFGLLLPFLLVVWAQQYVPSNLAAAFFPSIPLLMLVFSRFILEVQITKRKWFGLLVGSVGLLILSGPGTFSQIGFTGHYLPQLAIFASCVLLAAAAIFVRLMPKAPPIQTTSGALLAAAIMSLPIAVAEIPMIVPPLKPLLALLGVGIISTGAGNLLRYFLIRRKGPVFITPNAYLVAIVAAFLGVTLLGETLTPATGLGLVTIVAGLLIAQDGTGNMKRS